MKDSALIHPVPTGTIARSGRSCRVAPSGFILLWAWLSALVCALSLGPSFAHVLEALPRLTIWSPELWRETTVFNAQFQYFLAVGAPLDVLAIVFPLVLALLVRILGAAALVAGAAAAFYALALVLWFLLVAPANAVLATWASGPIPADFDTVQWRWETGHMAVASAKLFGYGFLVFALLLIGQGREPG